MENLLELQNTLRLLLTVAPALQIQTPKFCPKEKETEEIFKAL